MILTGVLGHMGMLTAVLPPENVEKAKAELKSHGIVSGAAGRFVTGEKLRLSTHEELWGILSRV